MHQHRDYQNASLQRPHDLPPHIVLGVVQPPTTTGRIEDRRPLLADDNELHLACVQRLSL